VAAVTETNNTTRIALAIARLKGGKLHITRDGIKTACGSLIPSTAPMTRPTQEWYLHTTCYNCAYRLWPDHGPAEYERPRQQLRLSAAPPGPPVSAAARWVVHRLAGKSSGGTAEVPIAH
jgi:hypothetical protein